MSDDNRLGSDLELLPDWAKDGYEPTHRVSTRGGFESGDTRSPRGQRRGPRGARGPSDRDATRRDRPQRPRQDRRDRPPPPRQATRLRKRAEPGQAPAGGEPPSAPRTDDRPPRDNRPPRDDRPRRDDRSRRDEPPPPPDLPLDVTFHPDERAAQHMANQIHALALAFPLFDLARMFLRNDASYQAHVIAREGAELWQVETSGELCLTRGEAEHAAFLLVKDDLYESARVPCEPPKGTWASVMRCRLDGTILSPVNHHAYHDEAQALWKSKYANMSFDRFLQNMETVRDEETVKAWLESKSFVTTWRRRAAADTPPRDGDAGGEETQETEAAPEGPQQETLEFSRERDAEDDFKANFVAGRVKKIRKARVSGKTIRGVGNPDLRHFLASAWHEEVRFPINMANRLRGVLQKRSLKIFKTDKNVTFVNVARPAAIDFDLTTPALAAILRFVDEHPGCTRKSLLEGLAAQSPGDQPAEPETAPATEPEAPQTSEPEPVPEPEPAPPAAPDQEALSKSLSLLLRQGYLVEFSNRRLAVGKDVMERIREMPRRRRRAGGNPAPGNRGGKGKASPRARSDPEQTSDPKAADERTRHPSDAAEA